VSEGARLPNDHVSEPSPPTAADVPTVSAQASRPEMTPPRPDRRRVGLVVVLLGVAAVGLAVANTLGALRPAQPADAIRISAPFTLRAASADTRQIAEAGFKNDRTIKSYEVREVVGEDGSLSLLVVVDAGMREGAGQLEALGRGIESTSGLTAAYEDIRDRRIAIAVGDTLSIAGWIEEPLGVYVYAVTPTRARQIVDAVLAAPRRRP
jgi:hypothetical protein